MTKFASSKGQSIAYSVHGPEAAETIVIQHGWTSCKEDMSDYTEAFVAEGYRCIAVDSLGHGESDKPADATLYGRESRANDVIAVLDSERIDRAHFLGYSMGGWIGCCVAEFHSDRLLSLMIGGHCPETGTTEEVAGNPEAERVSFDTIKAEYGLAWEEDQIPAMRHSFDALEDVGGHERAVAEAHVPVLLWEGEEEPAIYEKGKAMAERNGWAFFSVPGGHMEAAINLDTNLPFLLTFLRGQS